MEFATLYLHMCCPFFYSPLHPWKSEISKSVYVGFMHRRWWWWCCCTNISQEDVFTLPTLCKYNLQSHTELLHGHRLFLPWANNRRTGEWVLLGLGRYCNNLPIASSCGAAHALVSTSSWLTYLNAWAVEHDSVLKFNQMMIPDPCSRPQPEPRSSAGTFQ